MGSSPSRHGWLAMVQRQEKPALPLASSLISWRLTQEPSGLLTLFLKVGESQLARAWRNPAREVVRGLVAGMGSQACAQGGQHRSAWEPQLKDGKLPDKHVGNFWVEVKSSFPLLYPSAVLGLCGTYIYDGLGLPSS